MPHRLRVVFLVLDGLPVSVVGADVTPVLAQWCADSGTAPHTVPAVLPATTYPNHATFVTGVRPMAHGIVGNNVLGADGRFRPARKIGPRVPTVFDAAAAHGVVSALVVGDQELVGVMGGARADSHWPPEGRVPEGAAIDAHGYLDDDETLPVLLEVLRGDATLVIGHLNAPDTAGHVHGPESETARTVYRATDARLAAVRTAVEERGEPTMVIVVTDHSQETIDVPEPVDLTDALAGTGLTWFPEGSAALVYGEHPDLGDLLGPETGVAGLERLGDGVHVVWSTPGRWLCFGGIPAEPGMHGSPRTAFQLAAIVGNHPEVGALDARVTRPGFDATAWAGELRGLLALD